MAVQLEQVASALPSYEIGEELGRGSTGVVLAARHRQLGRDVAIKMLPSELAENPDVRRRFLAEAKLLASFSHVHIVPVYDFVEQDGLCLLVMERLGGGTLEAHARAGLDAPAGCAAVVALCSGLQYAHERGVLHRDVKPGNVLVAGDGTVKVTDFGLAKVLGGSETLVTRSGFVLGTPAYMAPEQARGTDPCPATDVYGAGTILYELLAGRLPFPPEANPLQMLYSRIHSEPRPLQEGAPDVPAPLAAVVMRALEREPADRYESADGLSVAVAEAAASAWGPDWLRATPFTVMGPGAIHTTGRHTAPELPETVVDGPAEEVDLAARNLVPLSELGEGDGGVAAPPRAPGPPSAGPPAATQSPPPREPPSTQPPTGPPGGPHRGRRLALALGVLALLVLAGGAIALLAGGDGDDGGGAEQAVTPPTPDTAPASAWRRLLPAKTTRQQAPAAVLAGKAWVLGGLGDGSSGTPVALDSVEAFDTAIGQWSTGPSLPVPVHHAMAAIYDDEVVLMGGWIPRGSNLSAISSDQAFALRGGKWVELPSMRSPRVAGAAATADDKLVVVGGQADGRLVPGTEVFDGNEWSSAAHIPTPREHLAAASDGRYVYAVGGRDLDASKNSTALERYDPVDDSWERLPDMPAPLGGLGAAIVDGRLVAVGGETATDVVDTTLVYDIAAEKWTRGPRLRTPRHGMAVAGFGDTVYALEGAREAGHSGSTTIAEALSFQPRRGN